PFHQDRPATHCRHGAQDGHYRRFFGGTCATPIDMASAYAVAANDGLKTPAYGITRITTLQGDVVYQHDDNAPRERLWSEQTVLNMHQLMRAVVTSGTGRTANVAGGTAVGETR